MGIRQFDRQKEEFTWPQRGEGAAITISSSLNFRMDAMTRVIEEDQCLDRWSG